MIMSFCISELTLLLVLITGVKKQIQSMLNSGVTYRCRFAQELMDSFMKGNWINKSCWDTQNLWNGELMEYKLGTYSMSFLRNGHNDLSILIKATVGMCCF